MSVTLTPYYQRIVRRQIDSGRFANEGEVIRHSLLLADALDRNSGPANCSAAGPDDLEELLLAGLDSGKSSRMTPTRKKSLYKRALESK